MTDQELKDLVAGLAVSQEQISRELKNFIVGSAAAQAKTDAHLAARAKSQDRVDAQIAETTRKLESIGIQMGNIGQNQGAVAEEFFFNSLQAKPVLGGVQYEEVIQNTRNRRGKAEGEYDIVLVNSNSVALIEVKYNVHARDVEKTIKGINNYRTLFPYHADYKIYGGIAGFKIAPEVSKLAKEQGLMVLKRVGDVIEVDAGQVHGF